MSAGKKKDLKEFNLPPQSRTAVNASAKGAMPAQPFNGGMTPGQSGKWEDLGGPTVDNYTPFNAKLDTERGVKTVRDVVNSSSHGGMEKPEPFNSGLLAQQGDSPASSKGKKGMMAQPFKGGMTPKGKMGMKMEEEEFDDESVLEDDYEYEEGEEDLSEDEEISEMEMLRRKRMRSKSMAENVASSIDFDTADIDYDFSEDIQALLFGEEFSEEFAEKAATIFEAAVRAKIDSLIPQISAAYEAELIESLDAIQDELVERVDSYLEYASQEWINENALQIEVGLKSELTESFMTDLKDLFEAHYVNMPEEKYDVLEQMVEKLDEMEDRLNSQIEKNIYLSQQLAESTANGIFSEVTEGLALSQREKLASLAEGVEFDGEESYRDKLETLKENYFSNNRVLKESQFEENYTAMTAESYQTLTESGSMQAYMRAIDKFSN